MTLSFSFYFLIFTPYIFCIGNTVLRSFIAVNDPFKNERCSLNSNWTFCAPAAILVMLASFIENHNQFIASNSIRNTLAAVARWRCASSPLLINSRNEYECGPFILYCSLSCLLNPEWYRKRIVAFCSRSPCDMCLKSDIFAQNLKLTDTYNQTRISHWSKLSTFPDNFRSTFNFSRIWSHMKIKKNRMDMSFEK